MSLYPGGITLKALLEDPNLINPPKLNQGDKNLKDGKDPLDTGLLWDPAQAYLGGQLWEKTLPYDANDFNLEYMDLDEFLHENGLPSPGPVSEIQTPNVSPTPRLTSLAAKSPMPSSNNSSQSNSPTHAVQAPAPARQPITAPQSPIGPCLDEYAQVVQVRQLNSSPIHGQEVKVEFHINEQDIMLATAPGQEEFNPVAAKFSEDDLRPQPMIKKSKKVFVPSDQKDNKYWARREKNNIAAKRSRDARRIKENQIALRAAFLETENDSLRVDLKKTKKENQELKLRIHELEAAAKAVSPGPE